MSESDHADPLAGDGPLVLMGGTFDPVHFGHLRPAEEVRVALGAERVTLVPCGDPPHRDAPDTPAEHRLAMARAAAEDRPTVARVFHPDYEEAETRPFTPPSELPQIVLHKK